LNFTFILSFFHLASTISNKTKKNTWTYDEFQKQVVLMLKELKKEM
jgi:hypothetical protein